MLLSLFCGAGGLDLGFEEAGFEVVLAFDKKSDSVDSYNHNRKTSRGHVRDVAQLTAASLDEIFGKEFRPTGVIGGPPCQSFSRANRAAYNVNDPRHALPLEYARLILELNDRAPVDFFVFENVPDLLSERHKPAFDKMVAELDSAFAIVHTELNAADFGVPQRRKRLFVVGYNRRSQPGCAWMKPEVRVQVPRTVFDAIGELEEPQRFRKGLDPDKFPEHRNHWCMAPKSPRFHTGELREGDCRKRSFKTLSWKKPSLTVAYGHREVHVHPSGRRRLSVYEALCLQGFPPSYELLGTLSSQIDQVSEAVPPPLAKAVAVSIEQQLYSKLEDNDFLGGKQVA